MLVALESRSEFRERMRALAAGASADRGWRAMVLGPQSSVPVELAARRIGGPGGGICWRLQALE